MARQQQQVAILIGLVVVMALVYARPRRRPASPPPTASATSPAANPPADVHTADPDDDPSSSTEFPLGAGSGQREAQATRAAGLNGSRDPFTRGGSPGQVSGLTLSGIMWDATAPIAIINGEMLHVGEQVDGYRLVEITPDRVSVTDDAETFQLFLSP